MRMDIEGMLILASVLTITALNVRSAPPSPRLNDRAADKAIFTLETNVESIAERVDQIEDNVVDLTEIVVIPGTEHYQGVVQTFGDWRLEAAGCDDGNICSASCDGPGGKPELALNRLLALLPAIWNDLSDESDPTVWLDPTLHPVAVKTEGDYGVQVKYPSNNCDNWTTASQDRESVVGILVEEANDVRIVPLIRDSSIEFGGCGGGFGLTALFPYVVCVADQY